MHSYVIKLNFINSSSSAWWYGVSKLNKGKRIPSLIKDILYIAHLTGIGLLWRNNCLCKETIFEFSSCEPCALVARASLYIFDIILGIILAVTLMPPWAPAKIRSMAV